MFSFRTIEEGLQQKEDNFLLLRFIAATMVIYGHAPAITGGGGPTDLFAWLGWGFYSGAIAVDLFFIISGFLVTGSFLRRRHVADFLWARLIRIVPAYAVCLLICAFVIGPVFTKASLLQYFSEVSPYQYVWANIHLQPSQMVWDIQGVFADNPQRTTINGSLWTLPAEVRMYLGVAVLGAVGIFCRRWLLNIVLIGILIYGVAHADELPFLPISGYGRLAGLFLMGMLCYVNRAWIPNHGGLLLAATLIAWSARTTWAYPYLFGLCEVLFVFWFAYRFRWYGFNRQAHRLGDCSYGIYLWGFPAQQMVAALMGGLPFLLNALAGFVLALLLGVLSWRFIEKPALTLKGMPGMLMQKLGRRWATVMGKYRMKQG